MASRSNNHKPMPSKSGGKIGPGMNKQKKPKAKGMHSKSNLTNKKGGR